MSIRHKQIDFGISVHDTPHMTQWESPMNHHQFFGVLGESTLFGENKYRMISVNAHLSKSNSMRDHLKWVNDISLHRGKFGQLIVDRGNGDAAVYDNCLFMGLEVLEPPFLDGSGVNGWVGNIVLNWRQSANEESDQGNN